MMLRLLEEVGLSFEIGAYFTDRIWMNEKLNEPHFHAAIMDLSSPCTWLVGTETIGVDPNWLD